MTNSKWFPKEPIKEVLFYLTVYIPEEGTVVFPGYYQEVFAEFLSESEKLDPEKHKINLQLLAMSIIADIEKLATDELHNNGWLTCAEQDAEVENFINVRVPEMLNDIENDIENLKNLI